MVVVAFTRWPGLLPPNFSAFYALAFCAGVYFPRRLVWWLPVGTMIVTDLLINLYYYFYLHIASFHLTQLVNYAVYAIIIWMGARFSARSSWLKLLSGGLAGAVLFFLITNTAPSVFNPFHKLQQTQTPAGRHSALRQRPPGW